ALHAAAKRNSSDRSLATEDLLAVKSMLPPAVDYFQAMERTLGRKAAERIPDDPYGEIVKALMEDVRPPIKEHMIVALLVAVTARLRDGIGSPIDRIQQPWDYFTQLSEWCGKNPAGRRAPQRNGRRSSPPWFHDLVIPAARLGAKGAEALRRSV